MIRIPIKIRGISRLPVDWIQPLLLALQSVLGILQLLDSFEVTYTAMIQRATESTNFKLESSLILSMLILLVYWTDYMILNRKFKALLFPILAVLVYPFSNIEVTISIASLLAVVVNLMIDGCFEKYISGVIISLSMIEVSALLHWVISVPLGTSSPFEKVARIEMGLFYLTGRIAPFIALLLMLLWLITSLKKFSLLRDPNVNEQEGEIKYQKYLLILILILGFFAPLYPYLPNVNPLNRDVGRDIPSYLKKMESFGDYNQVLVNNPRPVVHLLILCFQRLSGLNLISAIRYLPTLLVPLLVGSSYFLSSQFYTNKSVPIWTAFLTVCGVQVLVGIYSHFISNMLALSMVFLSLGFLFKALKHTSHASLLMAAFSGGLIVFTHPWTYDHYMVAVLPLAVLVVYDALIRKINYNELKLIIIYVLLIGFAELIKVFVFKGMGGVGASNTAIGGITGLTNFWNASKFIFHILYGGLLSNTLFLCLAVLGFFFLSNNKGPPASFFTFFMAITSILYLISNGTIKSRLLYNVPLQLFSSYGFIWMRDGMRVGHLKKSFTYFVVLSSLVYLFRSLANLTYIP